MDVPEPGQSAQYGTDNDRSRQVLHCTPADKSREPAAELLQQIQFLIHCHHCAPGPAVYIEKRKYRHPEEQYDPGQRGEPSPVSDIRPDQFNI